MAVRRGSTQAQFSSVWKDHFLPRCPLVPASSGLPFEQAEPIHRELCMAKTVAPPTMASREIPGCGSWPHDLYSRRLCRCSWIVFCEDTISLLSRSRRWDIPEQHGQFDLCTDSQNHRIYDRQCRWRARRLEPFRTVLHIHMIVGSSG